MTVKKDRKLKRGKTDNEHIADVTQTSMLPRTDNVSHKPRVSWVTFSGGDSAPSDSCK